MAKIKLITSNTGKNAERLDDSHIAGGNVKLNSYSGKRVLKFLIKLNMYLPYDPAITPGIHPEKWKVYSQKILYTNVQSSFVYNSYKLEITYISFNR